MKLPKITKAEAEELTREDASPESCGDCLNAWIPHADLSTRICGLIGDSSIIESDRLNPDCPLINKSRKSPTKADLVKEIARLRQDMAELVGCLRNAYEVYAGMEGVPVPETACEAYLLKIIKDFVKELGEGLAYAREES